MIRLNHHNQWLLTIQNKSSLSLTSYNRCKEESTIGHLQTSHNTTRDDDDDDGFGVGGDGIENDDDYDDKH